MPLERYLAFDMASFLFQILCISAITCIIRDQNAEKQINLHPDPLDS